jgi:uncharacterized protein (TIGR00156 family)
MGGGRMMKRVWFALVAGLLMAGGVVQAQFKDDTIAVSTVAEAKELKNGTWVVLEGHVLKRKSRNTYIFKDKTGQIDIEVNMSAWQGHDVTPDNIVRISGIVSKSWFSFAASVEVEKVSKAKGK